jgi:hypothetical protein
MTSISLMNRILLIFVFLLLRFTLYCQTEVIFETDSLVEIIHREFNNSKSLEAYHVDYKTKSILWVPLSYRYDGFTWKGDTLLCVSSVSSRFIFLKKRLELYFWNNKPILLEKNKNPFSANIKSKSKKFYINSADTIIYDDGGKSIRNNQRNRMIFEFCESSFEEYNSFYKK